MALNKILGFGTSATNELTDAAYAADAQRLSGNVPGVARSSLVNKALHGLSTMAAGLAQFLADRQGSDIVDTLTPAQVAALLTANLPSQIVGTARRLRAVQSTAGTSLTYIADELAVKPALGGAGVTIGTFSKTLNVATVGAGGMDIGTAPVSGFVAIYAILNTSTGVSALLATNATAAIQPEVYGGANMPAGYTMSSLVGVWPTNASSQLSVGTQVDREMFYYAGAMYNGAGVGGYTSLSIAPGVPRNAYRWKCNVAMTSSATGGISVGIAPTVGGTGSAGAVGLQHYGTTAVPVGGTLDIPIQTQQVAFFATGGSGNYILNAYGYTF